MTGDGSVIKLISVRYILMNEIYFLKEHLITLYFTIGITYLLLHLIFSGVKNSVKKYFIMLFGFLFLWPLILFNSLRLFFKVGKHLTLKGKLLLFFPAKETSKRGRDTDILKLEDLEGLAGVENFEDNTEPF